VRTRAAIVLVLAVAVAAFLPVARAGAGGFCMGYEGGEGFTDTEGDGVSMSDNCFSPTVIRVGTGDTVTFVNKDEEVHAVGGAVGSFGDPHAEIRPGDSVSYRFDREGTFPYVCIYHPGMAGAVVVGDGEGPAFEAGGIAPVFSSDEGSNGGAAGAAKEPATETTSSKANSFGWEALLLVAILGLVGSGLLVTWRRRSAAIEPRKA
jgi:plastocyanin